jgi:hypothetical protein
MQRQRDDDAMHVDLSRELLAGLTQPPQSASGTHRSG